MSAGGEAELLALVAEYRDAQCERILAEARAEAQILLRRALGDARRRVGRAVASERKRMDARLRSARAEMETARRMYRQRRCRAVLDEGWRRLGPALQAAWARERTRRRWVRRALEQAAATLPAGRWTVSGPEDWPEAEREALTRSGAGRADVDLRVQVSAGLSAGVIVSAAGGVLDASLQGLLADRPALEGRLLALLLAGESG